VKVEVKHFLERCLSVSDEEVDALAPQPGAPDGGGHGLRRAKQCGCRSP
jgi:hypothetical protein